MHNTLQRNLFFVKEALRIFKASNNFDVLDPQTQQVLMNCREPNLGFFTKMLRFTDYKRMTPFDIIITTPSGEKILRVKRGISIFLSTVEVFDENDVLVGTFKQKFFSIGGRFDILNKENTVVCSLKGKWTSWEFKFINLNTNEEYAKVTKKWAGIGRELFTSADNYILEIDGKVSPTNPIRVLILAAVMCIDMVLKE